MKYDSITNIEEKLPPDGLTGYIFHALCQKNFDTICETVTLEEGACMVLKGSAPVRERREMFLEIYKGCKEIADNIKRDVGWDSDPFKRWMRSLAIIANEWNPKEYPIGSKWAEEYWKKEFFDKEFTPENTWKKYTTNVE